MEWDGYGGVVSHRFSSRVDHQLHRRALHQWKWLVLAGVECAGFESGTAGVFRGSPLLQGMAEVEVCVLGNHSEATAAMGAGGCVV